MTLERAAQLANLAGTADALIDPVVDSVSSEFGRRVADRLRQLRPDITAVPAQEQPGPRGWCFVPVGHRETDHALEAISVLHGAGSSPRRVIAIVESSTLAEQALNAGASAIITAANLADDDSILDFAATAPDVSGRLIRDTLTAPQQDRVAAVEVDELNNVHLATDGMRRLLGYPDAIDLEGADSRRLFVDTDVHIDVTSRLATGGDIQGMRTEMRHFNGRGIPVVLDAARHASAEGHWVVVATDDRERRQLEAQLVASEEHHRFLTSATPVGLIEADFTPIALWFERLRAAEVTSFADHADDHPAFVRAALRLVEVRSANPAAARILGHEGFELVDVLRDAPENVPPLIAALDRLWQGTYRATATLTIRRDGRRDMHCTVEITIPRINGAVDYSRVLVTITDETKQVVTERSLVTAVRNFRTTFDKAPTAMFRVGLDGEVRAANESAAKLLGATDGDVIGRPFVMLVESEDRAAVGSLLADPSAATGRDPVTASVVHDDRDRRIVHLYASEVEDAYGRADHLIVQAIDNTDEVVAAAQRAAADRRFANIFRSAPGGLLLLDLDGRVIDANARAEQLLGPADDARSVRDWLRRLDTADRRRMIALWRATVDSQESHQAEGLRLRGVDSDRLLAVSLLATSDGDDETPYVICQLVDETPIISAQLDAQLSGDRFRTLFEHSPVPMFEQDFSGIDAAFRKLRQEGVTDVRQWIEAHPAEGHALFSHMRILDANHAAVQLLEAGRKGDLVGHTPMTTVTLASAESVVEQLVAIWERRSTLKTRIRGTSMLGRPIEGELHCLFRPTGSAQDTRVIVAMIDVREQRQLQRQLEKAATAADAFLSALSHRLRTPLTAVIGFAEEVEHGWHALSDEERAELATLAAAEGTLLARTIEDLLVVTRLDLDNMALRSSRLDVLQLLVEVARDLDVAATWSTDDINGLRAIGDPDRVKQIIRHLLDNARRHGGPNIEVAVHRSGEQIEITIIDDGFGIPIGDRIRVFLAGVSTARETSSPAPLGFGLSVAKRLAGAMGGDLAYRYEGGRSRFSLFLPAADEVTP